MVIENAGTTSLGRASWLNRRARPSSTQALGITKQNRDAAAAPDLVHRKYIATAPNQLRVAYLHGPARSRRGAGSIWRVSARCTPGNSDLAEIPHRITDLFVDAVTIWPTRGREGARRHP